MQSSYSQSTIWYDDLYRVIVRKHSVCLMVSNRIGYALCENECPESVLDFLRERCAEKRKPKVKETLFSVLFALLCVLFLGYACMAEIPLVIVNVQRVGPSTGQPTSPSQGDLMQARWGTHGDHWLIALTPASVPECFELTLRAYALSEKYRVPVVLLMDEVIGHMREKIELPDDYSEIPQAERKQPECSPEEFKAYATDDSLVPAMPAFGSGYRWHVTGLVHDETGFPKGTPAATLAATNRQHDKLYNNLDDIVQVENYQMEDAEYAVIAFGGGARTAYEAVDMARREGLKVGLMRPITIWPLADRQIKELASKVKGILVHELNYGQYVLEVERVVAGQVPVALYAKYDNEPATPAQLLAEIKKAMA